MNTGRVRGKNLTNQGYVSAEAVGQPMWVNWPQTNPANVMGFWASRATSEIEASYN